MKYYAYKPNLEELSCSIISIELELGHNADGIQTYINKLYENASFVVAINEQNAICGIVAFYDNNLVSKEAYISYIAVKNEYRNAGVGSILLETMEQQVLSKGFNSIKLEVFNENYSAISFYKKHHFTYHNKASKNSHYMLKYL